MKPGLILLAFAALATGCTAPGAAPNGMAGAPAAAPQPLVSTQTPSAPWGVEGPEVPLSPPNSLPGSYPVRR